MSVVAVARRYALALSTQPTSFRAVAPAGDLDRQLTRLRELGYDAVELAVRDPAAVEANSLRQALERSGMVLAAVGTGQAFLEEGLSLTSIDETVRAAAQSRLEAQIEFAGEFGALLILGLLRGTGDPVEERTIALERLAGAIDAATPRAVGSGVRIAVEAINRYETRLVNTAAEAVDLVRRVGSDHIGVLLDTFHMNIEETAMAGAIHRTGQHLFHVHVADSNRRHPGAGHIAFAPLFEALGAIGYTGYVSGEFVAEPAWDRGADDAIRVLRASDARWSDATHGTLRAIA